MTKKIQRGKNTKNASEPIKRTRVFPGENQFIGQIDKSYGHGMYDVKTHFSKYPIKCTSRGRKKRSSNQAYIPRGEYPYVIVTPGTGAGQFHIIHAYLDTEVGRLVKENIIPKRFEDTDNVEDENCFEFDFEDL